MNFDEDKWNAIVSQWENDDNADAADQLESDKDAMDLAQPSTWAAKDALDAGARKLTSEAAEPVRLRPPQLPSPEPATVGAGEKGPSASLWPEPTASPKLPPPSSLDWKGLQDRLLRAEAAKSTAQGYETLFANVGAQSGYRPNVHAGEEGVAMARAPLELAKERQAYESKQGAIDVNKAMSDPNSLQSQKARESVRAMFPGIKLPATFDNWSAADVQRYAKTGDLARLESARASAENARRDDERKATADAEKKAALDASRKAFSKQLVAAGIDPNTASEKDIDRVREDLRSKDSADRADASARRMEAIFAHTVEKDKKRETEGLPANMEVAEGANPAPEQLKDLGTVDRGADEVHRLANRMRQLLQETSRLGRAFNPDTVGAFKQLQGEMTLALKDTGKLGQISQGDQDLIDSIRPEATGPLPNIIRDSASFDRQLQGMERYADDKRAAAMKSMGVRHKGAGGGASGSVKMKFPDGSVHDVAPDKLEKARKKGGVPVDG